MFSICFQTISDERNTLKSSMARHQEKEERQHGPLRSGVGAQAGVGWCPSSREQETERPFILHFTGICGLKTKPSPYKWEVKWSLRLNDK